MDAVRAPMNAGNAVFPRFALLLLVLAALVLSGCATVPHTGRYQLVFLDQEEEMALGVQGAKEVLSKEKEEKGTARAKRVERIGKKIAIAADQPHFEWEFHTIPSKTLNAFCLPGGKIFVYTALLDLTYGNDDQLAAVIGHEVAHAVARHGAERMSQNQLLGWGGAITQVATEQLTGSKQSGETMAKGYAYVATLGVLLPYSRSHESEADEIGIILAAQAGYDPRAAIAFWNKMASANQGKEPPAFLSTHPLNEDRIEYLEEVMPKALEYYKKPAKKK